MSLSDAKIRSIKPSDKPFKLTDSHGLYLLVNPGGSRLWDLKYSIDGKEPQPEFRRLLPLPQQHLSKLPEHCQFIHLDFERYEIIRAFLTNKDL